MFGSSLNSEKAGLPILRNMHRVLFLRICSESIFGKSEFQGNLYTTKYRLKLQDVISSQLAQNQVSHLKGTTQSFEGMLP